MGYRFQDQHGSDLATIGGIKGYSTVTLLIGVGANAATGAYWEAH